MHRRNFLKHTGLLTGAGLLLQQQTLAAIFKTSEFKLKMLRDNVGIFTERGGSIGFMLGKEGIIVVDSQFPDTAAHLIEALRKESQSPIRYLLNTHHHGDHTGGNIAFKGIVENVVAHENAVKHLKAGVEKNNNADKVLLPDLSFSEEWELKLGDEKIKGDYYGAGHTNGDAIYHFQNANVMHVGDLMFNKRHPYVDRAGGANMENWIKVLDRIIKKANKDTIIIFGHSLNPGEETGSIEDLKKFQDYLGRVLVFADQEIKKGVSRESFIANKSIPGESLWSGPGIERPLSAAYDEKKANSQ